MTQYQKLLNEIDSNKVLVISKDSCPNCTKIKELFDTLNINYTVYMYTDDQKDLLHQIKEHTKGKSFPFCYYQGKYIGSYEQIYKYSYTGKLKNFGIEYEIDF